MWGRNSGEKNCKELVKINKFKLAFIVLLYVIFSWDELGASRKNGEVGWMEVGNQFEHILVILQEHLLSSNLNICIRQADGSYSGDSLESPKDLLDEKP